MQIVKNIQFQQLINLTLLIALAYSNNTLQTSLPFVALLVIFAASLELFLKKEIYLPFSAAITALGVVLMVGWLAWYIPFIAIMAALLQKHYLKIDGVHIFNPSNFALIFALALFYPKALPIVGELGRQSFVLYIVLVIGAAILIRVNRYIISLSFLISYILFSYLIIGNSDPSWSFEHFIDSLYSSSFVVYILFMLTDPITTPKSLKLQLLFGVFVAMISVGMNYWFGIRVWHMFIALFLVTAVATILFKRVDSKEFKKYITVVLLALTISAIITSYKPLYFSM